MSRRARTVRPSRIILNPEVKANSRPSRIVLDSRTLDQDLQNIPTDISKNLLSYLTCQDIVNVKSASNSFNDLVNDDVIKLIKYKGFPRPNGTKLTRIYENPKNREQYLNQNYKAGAIRGDLFFFSNLDYNIILQKYIFDGCQFIAYKDFLPTEFVIISDNVPKDYWRQPYKNNRYMTFYTHTPDANLDLNLIRAQINKYLITNAGNFRDDVIIPFTVNNKKYYLELKKSQISKLRSSNIVRVELGDNTLRILF